MKRPQLKRKSAGGTGPLKNIVALGFVGDALVALIWPRRQLRLWRIWPRWPRWYREMTRAVERRPSLVRATAAVELMAALWWTERIYRKHGV